MKAADAAFVDSAFKELLKRGNTIEISEEGVAKASNGGARAKHWLLRVSGHESEAWLQRACRSFVIVG